MTTERQQLESGIAALEAQRAILGDSVVEAAMIGMRTRLSALAGASTEPDQQLKQVTILFLDVVGSTALGQKLDPEEISDVMDGVLARGTVIVERHGGRVLQYAGDNLLAAFGADEVREDDAERAVRCGLALLDLGQIMSAEVLAAHNHADFNTRIGLHTGGVLLGGGVDEGSIRGSAVNIAARMEQTAPPGGMRISHETYTRVRGVFEVTAEPPITVKGLAEPVATYLVRGVKAREFRVTTRGIDGVETRMIGRDDEFEVLKDAFKNLFGEAKLAAVSIVGEAGLGKSRLIYEFSNWAEARPENFLLFQGRATPQTPDQPYGLLRDIIAWRWQIADGDSMDLAKSKLEAGLMPLFKRQASSSEAEAHCHLLGFLIGLDYSGSPYLEPIKNDQKQIRDRAFFAATEMFRLLAAQRKLPIVMQLDDLHWADDPSLDFLFYLANVAKDVPLLIIGVTRGTLFERREAWIGTSPHRRIDLRPFDKSVSRELANELLKNLPEAPSELRDLISGGADGNPFYMEELVKMLIDKGAITTGAIWTLRAEQLVPSQVPATLTGVLQARLDGLPAAERQALRQASVIGMVFWDQALAALDASAVETLPDLTRRELALLQKNASLSGMREYTFKHHILHQVTLETVLKHVRRKLHSKIGDWFAGLSDARAAEHLAVAGEHYLAAGELDKACQFFFRAAEQAKARFANDTAIDLIERALPLIDSVASSDRAELRWRLIDVRERTYETQGRREQQGVDLLTLSALAEQLGDQSRSAEIAYRQSHRALRMGDWHAQTEAARRGIKFAALAGNSFWRLMAQRVLAIATLYLGDDDAATKMAMTGLAESRTLGFRNLERDFVNTMAAIAFMRGDQVSLREHVHLQLEIAIELNDPKEEMSARVNCAASEVEFGRFAVAQAEADRILMAARVMGDRVAECSALGSLAEISFYQEQGSKAFGYAQLALNIAVDVQNLEKEIASLMHLGDAQWMLGRTSDAVDSFTRLLGRTSGWGFLKPNALAGLARVALTLRDSAAAVAHLEPVIAEILLKGAAAGEVEHSRMRLTCWQALQAANDQRAPQFLQMAHDQVQSVATRITDKILEKSFLANNPTNRAIEEAWAMRPIL